MILRLWSRLPCATVAALAFVSCSRSEEHGVVSSGSLLAAEPALVELADPPLPADLLDALRGERVRIVDDTPRGWTLEDVGRKGVQHWRASTRFPVRGAARLVRAEDAHDPDAGRRLAESERPDVPVGGAIIGSDGIELWGQARKKAYEYLTRVTYETDAADVWKELFGGRLEPSRLGDLVELDLDDESRSVVFAPAPSRAVWPLRVSADGQLLAGFGLSTLRYRLRDGGIELDGDVPSEGRVRFAIEITVDGDSSVAWSRTLSASEADRFHDVRVELAHLAGQRVEVAFRATADGPTLGAPLVPFWSAPRLDAPDPAGRPNVVVVVLDTLRADRIGCYGNERSLTPNIDALAARGVRFADAVGAAPLTLPAHATLFSSLYPSQHGTFVRERLAEDVVTLAEVLHGESYATEAISEGGFLRPKFGLGQGFERFSVRERGIEGTFLEALERMRARRGPHFTFVQTYEVHTPYAPPESERARVVHDYDGALPETFVGWNWRKREAAYDEADVRYLSELYDAEVAHADLWVGKLVEGLTAAGQLENTLFVLTSDHGEEFHDHGLFGHGHSLYQELLHVPLIVYQAGRFEGGAVVEHPVHAVDLAPSVLDAVGSTPPSSWVGRPLSLDPPEAGRALLSVYYDRERKGTFASVRDGSLKLIQPPGADDPDVLEIYDLSSDPHERHNLWDSERGVSAVERVKELLRRHAPIHANATAATISAEHEADLKALGYGGDDE